MQFFRSSYTCSVSRDCLLLTLTKCLYTVEAEKAVQSIHNGVGDTGSLQVSLYTFSGATLVRHLVVLRIRFTVYRYVGLPTVGSYLYGDLVFHSSIDYHLPRRSHRAPVGWPACQDFGERHLPN